LGAGGCDAFTKTYPSLSGAGCTAGQCPAGDYDASLSSGGLVRAFHLHVPDRLDPTQPAALVLSFHGAGSNGRDNESLERWHPLSDQEGFLVVEPDGTSPSALATDVWNAGACCGVASDTQIDDVGFVGQLIDTISATLSVDPKRVFSTGFSNGGALSHRLACEMSGRIAAIAPVAGLMLDVDLDAGGVQKFTCAPTRPVPVFEIHGSLDEIALYNGGKSTCLIGTPTMRSVGDTIADWAQRNGCMTTQHTDPAPNDRVLCRSYDGCAAQTTLCTVKDMGHAWPGAAPVNLACLGPWSDALMGTQAIWDFFRAHPLAP
jgi:polyhydroxybutyrate depolymerase